MSAWIVLFIGMGTVFVSLFAIIGLAVALKMVLVRRPTAPKITREEPRGNPDELVAVISAAVASMLGTSVQNIRIASIEKSGMTAPAWALAERYGRQPQGTVPRYGK